MKKTTVASPAAKAAGGLDISIVAALAKIAGQHDLSEVEIEHEGLKVRVARERRATAVTHVMPASTAYAAPAPAPAPAAISAPAEVSPSELPGAVKSPMVGTAYLRPSPELKPFVEIGSVVKAGEKILLVEAMKTFNEIVAPRTGKVTHILVEDGSPVEYGQALMVIE
jgi:acetyl-CoA carboxylase biotin carboxyl carrier protein